MWESRSAGSDLLGYKGYIQLATGIPQRGERLHPYRQNTKQPRAKARGCFVFCGKGKTPYLAGM